MSNRDVVVKRLVSSINQIIRWVDIVFPELRQVFKDVKGNGALATLRLIAIKIVKEKKGLTILIGCIFKFIVGLLLSVQVHSLQLL